MKTTANCQNFRLLYRTIQKHLRIKYKRSLVKIFKKTISFRQTELLSSTDGRNLNITENSHKLKDKNTCYKVKKNVRSAKKISVSLKECCSCERFRNAFDVGKDCKVTSVCWLSPFKEHTNHLFWCRCRWGRPRFLSYNISSDFYGIAVGV